MTNQGGVFSAGTGTVTLNGDAAQSISAGGSAFNVLTIENYSTGGVTFANRLITDTLNAGSGVKKLSFSSASESLPHTVYTTFNVSGSAGNLIDLVATTPGAIWYIDAPASSVEYLRVEGSHQADGATITAAYSVDLGDNTNWNITP